MSKTIKKMASSFIIKHNLSIINYNTLKVAAKNIGYTIIEFNNIFNDKDVDTVIQNLNLNQAVLQSRGFTYVSEDYRLIFINEDLSDDEKTLVLSHELGHIVCEHFTNTPVIGQDVKEEHEANEFAHYLLKKSVLGKWKIFVVKHKRGVLITIFALCVLILVTVVTVTVKKEQSYYDNYYITATGKRYHKKDCIFVKNKTTVSRLSKEDFEKGTYKACDMCLPDE